MDRLSNTVRPYAWGSTTALPELLGIAPTGEPQAEMWMGAHPGAPSRVTRDAAEQPLSDLIASDPVRELGPAAVEKFGPRLPFLLKILAAGAPSPSRFTPTSRRRRRVTQPRRARASRSTHRTATTKTQTTSPN